MDRTQVSHIAGRHFTLWATRGVKECRRDCKLSLMTGYTLDFEINQRNFQRESSYYLINSGSSHARCVAWADCSISLNLVCKMGIITTASASWSHCGFPGDANGKESACQCRGCKRWEFNSWIRKIPWRRAWQPTPVFLPGEPHGQRSLVGYSPQGHKELNMTEVI